MAKRYDDYYGFPIKPEFDPVEIWPWFETAQQINQEQNTRIELLMGSPYSEAGRILQGCEPDDPCESGACAWCGTRYHRWFAAAGMEAMADHEEIHLLTYVPDPVYPPEFPVQLGIKQLCQRFIRRIERLGRTENADIRFVASVEVSIQRKLRTLVPHIHAVVAGATRNQLLAAHPGQGEQKLIGRPWVVSENPVADENRPKVFTYLYKIIARKQVHDLKLTAEAKRLIAAYEAGELSSRPRIKITDEAQRLSDLGRKNVSAHVNLEVERLAALHEHYHADFRVLRGVSSFDLAKLRVTPTLQRRQREGYRQWDRPMDVDWPAHPSSCVNLKRITTDTSGGGGKW